MSLTADQVRTIRAMLQHDRVSLTVALDSQDLYGTHDKPVPHVLWLQRRICHATRILGDHA